MLHSNTLLQPNNSTYYTLNEINNVIVEDENRR